MTPEFRPATRDDVRAVVALLRDDILGAERETADDATYFKAFDDMTRETGNQLIVGQGETGRLIATYQLTFITGLSLCGTKRAQIESVRVASDLRGQSIGHALINDAIARAEIAGCGLVQLTMAKGRNRAGDFYAGLGFTPSHVGYKRVIE